MVGPIQTCSAQACEEPALFRARTRAAWCETHTAEVFASAGVAMIEAPTKRGQHVLTRCLQCGCEAHYRLDYAVEKADEGVCRACYWRAWGVMMRGGLAGHVDFPPEDIGRVEELAESMGYEYLGPLVPVPKDGDPHLVRCTYCGNISAQRSGDIAWGCSCRVNASRGPEALNEAQKRGKRAPELLKDCGGPVVRWWDHTENPIEWWETVTVRAYRVASWCCPDCSHRFTAKVNSMVTCPQCPICESKHRLAATARRARYVDVPVSTVPTLLRAWDDDADPDTVPVVGSAVVPYNWRCDHGHRTRLNPYDYMEQGCRLCRSDEAAGELEDLYTQLAVIDTSGPRLNPEIVEQWHPTANARLDVDTISPNSRRVVWWRDPNCGHEWQATPRDREMRFRRRCPTCDTILDSLAYHFPRLAAEWSPNNPTTAWHVRPSGTLGFTPEWVCSSDPSHRWHQNTSSRINGSGCPECQEIGKSRIELEYVEQARLVFGNAASGRRISDSRFEARASWTVDMLVQLNERSLAIEYDGEYWHRDKIETDTAKSEDLLRTGHAVARLREHPLPPLAIINDRYMDLTVFAGVTPPAESLARIAAWLATADDG